MYWTCGQCCVFRIWVMRSNIVIGLYVLDMWSVLCVPYGGVGYNIVIGMDVLVMWSVYVLIFGCWDIK